MKIKLERWGKDLALPLPDHLIERHNLKEGDWLDGESLVAEFSRLGRDRSADSDADA